MSKQVHWAFCDCNSMFDRRRICDGHKGREGTLKANEQVPQPDVVRARESLSEKRK